jgi:hypothetical protein
MKFLQQTITTVEIDTDTGNIRLIRAFTKNLGEGNGKKKPKSKDVQGTLSEEEL